MSFQDVPMYLNTIYLKKTLYNVHVKNYVLVLDKFFMALIQDIIKETKISTVMSIYRLGIRILLHFKLIET